MSIVKPAQMDFSDKKFSMIIAGPPGVGKTTLALSAPNPVLIDFDQGISRVKAQHRKDTIVAKTYEDVLVDIESEDIQMYDTIIIDTGGSLITYLQDWAMRKNPVNRQKSGGISQKGFGAVKAEFIRFTNHLKYTLQKNVIYIFHTVEEKDKDGEIVQRLMCEGSARNIVWQPCDFGCFVFIAGNGRVAGFTPTEQYFAKGCHGIDGIKQIPTLSETSSNAFLSKLFDQAKENIAIEAKEAEAERAAYDKVMADATKLIDTIKDPKTAQKVSDKIQTITHTLTSEREIRSMMLKKLKEVGVEYDKEKGAFVCKPEPEPVAS